MSKSSHAPPVQLFPFLAVLICAMGALILLLLVTTRRIRHVAVEKAIKEQQAAALEAAPQTPLLPPSTPLTDVDPAPLYVPPVAVQLARPVPVVDEAAAVRLRAEWSSIVQELARDYAAEVKLLAALRAEALAKDAERKSAETALTEQIKKIDAQKLRAQRLRNETAADVARLEEERANVDGAIRSVKKATQVKAEDLANQPVPYTLLPYDGALGTTRRPIIIECDERSIIFRCEGIELTAQQLSGFPSNYNPLLAGTRALHEYWVVRDRETATLRTPPPPYVLLVVRPKGTVAFYVARKLLEKFEHPFGYELVEEGRELTWPASDEQATRVCRESIERVLAERERLMTRESGGRPGLPGELRYDGRAGEFATEEVDRLRNLDASVVVGGQRWRRDSSSTGSGEPTPFQSAARGPGQGLAPGQRHGLGPAGPHQPGRESGRGGTSGGLGRADGPDRFSDPSTPEDYAPDGSLSGMPGGDELASTNGPALGEGPAGSRDASGSSERRPSPNDHRLLPGTFQGSSGPRLGPSSGGSRSSSPGSAGELRPWHDHERPSDETVLPQGTGPINSRSLAQNGAGRPGVPGASQGPQGTSPPAASASTGTSAQNSSGSGRAGTPSGVAGGDGTGGSIPRGGSDEPSAARGFDPFGDPTTPGGRIGPDDESGSTDGPFAVPGRGSEQPDEFRGGASASGGASGPRNGTGTGSPHAAGRSGAPGGPSSPFGGGAQEAPSEAPEGMPVPRNLRAIGQGDPSGKGKPADRRWGAPEHSGSIALERSVTIDVKEHGVFLEDEPEISLRQGTAYRELKDRLAFTLDGHVGKWGRPPASFYWLPSVTFRIHPGGNQYYQALKALTDDWGLRSKVEHVLE